MQELTTSELKQVHNGLKKGMVREGRSILQQSSKAVEWRLKELRGLTNVYRQKFEDSTGVECALYEAQSQIIHTMLHVNIQLEQEFKQPRTKTVQTNVGPVSTSAETVLDKKARQIDKREANKDIYTDRSLGLLWNRDKLSIKGPWNYKTKWCHDVITQKLWDWIAHEGIPKQTESLFEFDSTEQVIEAVTELQSDLPVVVFTDKDFRDITGKDHLSGEQIKALFDEYKEVRVKGALRIFYDSKTKKYVKVHLNDPLFDVRILESGKYSKTGKKPVWHYVCRMNLLGFILFNNLLQHKLKGHSREFFKLKGGEQDIYRVLSLLNKARYKYTTLVNILGLTHNPQNLRTQKAGVEKYLNGLQGKGFIKNWIKDQGQGMDTTYFIHRI